MKNLRLGITALAVTAATTVSAQTTTNKWLIGVGAHGVNHAAIKSTFKPFSYPGETFTLNNYTITPPLSKLTVARNLNKFFVVDWQTSVGNVDNKRIGMDKEFFLMTGLGLQFKFNGLWNEESWLDPYVRAGANYLRHDYRYQANAVDNKGKNIGANHFAVNGGVGVNFWITKNFGIGVLQEYVGTPTERTTISDFWQSSATINFRFGNRDRDKDGVLDKDDLCPDVPGPKENDGCPWPDTDGDGILDKDDACPEVAGPKENNGCPWPDTDGDGILDKDDACPTVPGLPEYNGCPKPAEVFAKEATGALQGITFDFAKATLTSASNVKLDQAAEIIKSSNGGQFLVTGHTDKRGKESFNLRLSRERAAAVVKALEARGVNEHQLKSTGVGSREAVVPVDASNAEREKDRKVVVQAIDKDAFDALQKSDLPVVQKKVVKKKTATKRK